MAECCAHGGPGYATPLDAFNSGDREKLLYVPCVVPDHSRPDYLATVDAETGKVIHRLHFPYKGDELHHSGWNACSSCHGDSNKKRSNLILPALGSGRVYAVDTATDPRAPRLAHTLEPETIKEKTGATFLHTSHCLGSGDILISAMGDEEGGAKGTFLLLDQELKVKGSWSEDVTKFGYDFWYQPRHNVLISSAWGTPRAIVKGFNPAEVADLYGSSLYVWDWERRKLVDELPLGSDGLIPLEVRFKHDPASPDGYCGAALSSNLIHITKDADGKWGTKVAFKQDWVQVDGWVLPTLPPLITDILISLDDKYLYMSNWLRGDIVQLDITDPANPRVAGRVFLGGVAAKGNAVKVTGGLPEDVTEIPEAPVIKGQKLLGGPQMIQLSLDGKRLYVTNSLYSVWDQQFYPEMVAKGSTLVQIDVDTVNGGMKINPDFLVDFGAEPDGPVLAHEVRYPGGDCSSDIWL